MISGVSTTNTNFNGTFSGITVIDANNFRVFPNCGERFRHRGHHFGSGRYRQLWHRILQFGVSQTTQGIAINPISRAAVMADPNSNAAQVTFLNTLDQSLTSILLQQGVVLGGSTTGAAGEIGDTAVAYQPYSNTALVLNPRLAELSLIDPSPRVSRVSQSFQRAAASQAALSTFPAAARLPLRFRFPVRLLLMPPTTLLSPSIPAATTSASSILGRSSPSKFLRSLHPRVFPAPFFRKPFFPATRLRPRVAPSLCKFSAPALLQALRRRCVSMEPRLPPSMSSTTMRSMLAFPLRSSPFRAVTLST